MSLKIDYNINPHLVNQKFDNTNQSSLSSLPYELVLKIFSHLNLNIATLRTICDVSEEWNRLASKPIPWKTAIYKELAFGNDKWAQFFGKDVVKNEDSKEEFSSLPLNIVEDYRRFQSAFPEKSAKDSLMLVRLPKTLNGQLTLKSLEELTNRYFEDIEPDYRFVWCTNDHKLGDRSIDKSRWILMTKDVLPGSRNESYAKQKDIVADLAQKALIGYEVPETLEAAACILAQYFDSNICLFSDSPSTYTRCKEKIRGEQVFVGGLDRTGLTVTYDGSNDDPDIGVAALRKF
jgi:F-box-like